MCSMRNWLWIPPCLTAMACFSPLPGPSAAFAQVPAAPPAASPAAEPSPDAAKGPPSTNAAPPLDAAPPEAQLAVRQSTVADKYSRLEKLLFDLSAIEGAENPRRAALLRRAFQQSTDNLTHKQLETLTELLRRKDYRRASDEQTEVMKDLNALLELLLSEDRPERLKSEQEKIREFIKEVDRLIRLQSSVQGRTEGGVDPKNLRDEQEKVADRTDALAKKMEESEAKDAAQGESKSGDLPNQDPGGKPEGDKPEGDKPEGDKPEGDKPEGDKPEGDKPEGDKPEGDKPEGDKPEGDKPMSESKPPEPKGSDAPPMPSEPSESAPGEKTPKPQDSPGQPGQPMPPSPSGEPSNDESSSKPEEDSPRKRIRAAEERMREAQKRLEEAKRKESLDAQEKAKEELQKAKAELEEILRQLREEEVERLLALLESRFRKMLELELRVYESTKRLDRVPEADRGRDFAIQANNLGNDQRKIAIEADKALLLLREEGSSIAFPETVEQMRDEMNLMAERLAALKTNFITQEGEEEIIAALEELITALQKAQQDQQQRKQQDQQQQPPSDEDPPLVDSLAELKMIRALQMRVNTRTQRFARLLADVDDPVGQVDDKDLIEALEQLAERERKVLEITRDLILGKNK